MEFLRLLSRKSSYADLKFSNYTSNSKQKFFISEPKAEMDEKFLSFLILKQNNGNIY